MAEYNTKTVRWPDGKKEILRYTLPVRTGIKSKAAGKTRKKYDAMSDEEKEKSNKRRLQYYKKRIRNLARIAESNSMRLFITLTFADEVRSYDDAKLLWQQFLKRLRYRYPGLKYLCVHELQKKRGVYHFHFLTDIDWIPFEELQKMWGNGYVFVKRLQPGHIGYVLKYITKDVQDEAENLERKHERKIYCSRNLQKPNVEKVMSKDTIDDIMFDYMEEIENAYSYPVMNYLGIQINHVECIKIKKERV